MTGTMNAQQLSVIADKTRDALRKRHELGRIRLLLLTGCRLSEIQKLKWHYVDLKAGVLRLPDSKTGAKLVAIGKAVVDVFKSIEKIEGNPYVITGQIKGQHLTDMQRPWRRLRKRAELGAASMTCATPSPPTPSSSGRTCL